MTEQFETRNRHDSFAAQLNEALSELAVSDLEVVPDEDIETKIQLMFDQIFGPSDD